jgi:uncharacterized protein YegL
VKISKLYLFLVIITSALLAACGPIGGDAQPGVSACPALNGQSTWKAPTGVNLGKDSGMPVTAAKVLAAQVARMTTSGGAFTLNLELQDANGDLLYDNLTVQNFVIDTSSPLVLRMTEGVAVDTQVGVTTEAVDVKKPSVSGLTGVLVFDSSGSTNGTDGERLRVSGGQLFADTVMVGTQLAVMDFGVSEGAFDGDVVSDCFKDSRLLNDFTSDKLVAKNSMDRITAAGGTPMYGALEDALSLTEAVNRMGAQQPFLIVFTDGDAQDYDEARATNVIARAKAMQSSIHTVALMDAPSPEDSSPDDDDINLLNLQRLSAETGGLSLLASSASELPAYFNALANASNSGVSITARFGLTFNPPVAAGFYFLEGRVNSTVNGATASAPFRLLIDLRRANL